MYVFSEGPTLVVLDPTHRSMGRARTEVPLVLDAAAPGAQISRGGCSRKTLALMLLESGFQARHQRLHFRVRIGEVTAIYHGRQPTCASGTPEAWHFHDHVVQVDRH